MLLLHDLLGYFSLVELNYNNLYSVIYNFISTSIGSLRPEKNHGFRVTGSIK